MLVLAKYLKLELFSELYCFSISVSFLDRNYWTVLCFEITTLSFIIDGLGKIFFIGLVKLSKM